MPDQEECFVIMPISDQPGYDAGHFQRVYDDIHKVAIERAGFKPIRSDEVLQTNMIHLDILQRLLKSPLVFCDISGLNPNVFFELGLRQAFDKPVVIVQELGTPKIFDITPLRYREYRRALKYREVLEDQESIHQVINATIAACKTGDGGNSLVKLLSLEAPARMPDASENDTKSILQILISSQNELRNEINSLRLTRNVYPDQISLTRSNFIDEKRIEIEGIFKANQQKELLWRYQELVSKLDQIRSGNVEENKHLNRSIVQAEIDAVVQKLAGLS
jgi:hypothetical protein